MQAEKLQKIHGRREEVLQTLFKNDNWKKDSFDQLVKQTGFSRAEIAHHLAILVRRNQIIKKSDGGYRRVAAFDFEVALKSYNLFMYGTSSPIHVFGRGVINSPRWYE